MPENAEEEIIVVADVVDLLMLLMSLLLLLLFEWCFESIAADHTMRTSMRIQYT
jgi:hypothetical protein